MSTSLFAWGHILMWYVLLRDCWVKSVSPHKYSCLLSWAYRGKQNPKPDNKGKLLLIEQMSFCLEAHVYKLWGISILWVQSSTLKHHWNFLILTTWACFLPLSYLFILNMRKTPSDIWREPWQVYRKKIWHHFMFF